VRATCRGVYAESVPERLTVYVPVCGWYGMVWDGMLFGIYAVEAWCIFLFVPAWSRCGCRCSCDPNWNAQQLSMRQLGRRHTVGRLGIGGVGVQKYSRDGRVVNKPRKKLEAQSQKPIQPVGDAGSFYFFLGDNLKIYLDPWRGRCASI
jgi:hypothetical protein